MRYVDEFLSLKSCSDILRVVSPIKNGSKEISEAMGVRAMLRNIVLNDESMKYTLLDFCAGNSLASIISIFTLPFKQAIAYDYSPHKLRIEYVKRFEYKKIDILKDDLEVPENSILCGVHPCKNLSERIIEIYKENVNAKALVLMPCCTNPNFKNKLKIEDVEYLESSLMDNYVQWCWYLSRLADGRMFIDKDVESEKNVIITANKNVRMIKNFGSGHVNNIIKVKQGE